MFGTEERDLTAEVRRRMPGSFVEVSAGVTHHEVLGDAHAATVC